MTLRSNKITLTAVLASVLASGCYGQFSLTRKLYGWNNSVTDSKVGKSALMWGLLIVPVYQISGAVDLLIFNVIEFYSGENPLAVHADGSVTATYGGHHYRWKTVASDEVEVTLDGTRAVQYRNSAEGYQVRDLRSQAHVLIPHAEAYAKAQPAMHVF